MDQHVLSLIMELVAVRPVFKYFISFIIHQLGKVKSTYNGCNLRGESKSAECCMLTVMYLSSRD